MPTQEEDEAKAPQYYEMAVAVARQYITRVRANQWDVQTPCPDWNVQQLISHIVGSANRVPSVLGGTGYTSADDILGDDALAAFDTITKTAITAFQAYGSMDQVVTSPAGESSAGNYTLGQANEMLVHGWDLAKATGQDTTMNADLLEMAYARAQRSRERLHKSPVWGDEADVAEDADTQAKFLAILGRA